LRKTEKMHRAIRNKRRRMLTSGVVLLHDNARLHKRTAACTRALLEYFNWELFDFLLTALILL
jgi:transposase